MKEILVAAILACACCGGPPAQAQLAAPGLQPAAVEEHPAPAERSEPLVVMTELDYQRLMRMLKALTNALEQRNAEVEILAGKLKETCP